jgi:hypothetical protein
MLGLIRDWNSNAGCLLALDLLTVTYIFNSTLDKISQLKPCVYSVIDEKASIISKENLPLAQTETPSKHGHGTPPERTA